MVLLLSARGPFDPSQTFVTKEFGRIGGRCGLLLGFRLDVWDVLSDSGQVEVATGCVRVWGIKAFNWWMVETRSSCWKGEWV